MRARGGTPQQVVKELRPSMITTILAFIVTLGLLIVVHEYGHYRVAVACGVKVLRFSVGFGRVAVAPPAHAATTPSSSSARCRSAAT